MKATTQATLIAALFGITASAALHADEVRVDQAGKLIEEGKIQSFEKLNQAALENHQGARIEDTELEDEYGRYIYQVELRDQDGQEWDLDLDASNGEILREERDD